MNSSIERRTGETAKGKTSTVLALLVSALIAVSLSSGAEIPLQTVTYSALSGSDRMLKVDLALPEIDSVQKCTVEINALPGEPVAFVPADQLTGQRCALLLVVDPRLGSEQSKLIQESLSRLSLKASPSAFRIGLASISNQQLKLLIAPSEPSAMPKALSFEGKSGLSYYNVEQAVQELSRASADRKLVVLYSNGYFETSAAGETEIVRTALAAHIQICAFGVDPHDATPTKRFRNSLRPRAFGWHRAPSDQRLSALTQQTEGLYFKDLNPKNNKEAEDQLLKFATSGGRITLNLSQAAFPAKLRFLVQTASGKTYTFTHQVENIFTALTPSPTSTSSPIVTSTISPTAKNPASPESVVPILVPGALIASSAPRENRSANPPTLTAAGTANRPAAEKNDKPTGSHHKKTRRTRRHVIVAGSIAAAVVLMGSLIWRSGRVFNNRIKCLDRQFGDLKEILIKRVEINISLAGELAKMTDELTNTREQLKAKQSELRSDSGNLGDAKQTMIALAYGLWDLRRFLVLPGEKRPRDTFDGQDAQEMFDLLEYTIKSLQMQDFCAQDKTGSIYRPGAFEVKSRRTKKGLLEPMVFHTERPEILWKGEQLARAQVSIEIPAKENAA
jgi:hypothetical protein